MAKLKLRNGAKEIARWRNERGDEYLLRSDGGVLRKVKGGSWKSVKLAKPVGKPTDAQRIDMMENWIAVQFEGEYQRVTQ